MTGERDLVPDCRGKGDVVMGVDGAKLFLSCLRSGGVDWTVFRRSLPALALRRIRTRLPWALVTRRRLS